MDFRATFARTLTQLREAAGLTQQQLADACDFPSQSRVGNYERGRGLPSIPDLLVMARALHVDVCEFFGQPSRAVRLDPEMIAELVTVMDERWRKGGRTLDLRDERAAARFVEGYEAYIRMKERDTPENVVAFSLVLAELPQGGKNERGSDVSVAGTPKHNVGSRKGRKA